MSRFFSVLAITIVIYLSGCNESTAEKNNNSEASDKLFIVQLSLGKNWDSTKESHLQVGFQSHVNNLKQLRESGKIVIGARYSDFGMLIIKADSLSEVQGMMQNDPMITDSLFIADVNEFRPFYNGCTTIE